MVVAHTAAATAQSGDTARMARSILVGLDGRDAAWRALERALDLCDYGSRLTVCVVRKEGAPPEGTAGVIGPAALDMVQRRLLELFSNATICEALGDPASELARLALELDADILVVGHNNGAYPRPPGLGSVSERLVYDPPCDVLVVR